MSIRKLWVDMPGEIVRNVNLDVKEGEILGIGGLAGQGKLARSATVAAEIGLAVMACWEAMTAIPNGRSGRILVSVATSAMTGNKMCIRDSVIVADMVSIPHLLSVSLPM